MQRGSAPARIKNKTNAGAGGRRRRAAHSARAAFVVAAGGERPGARVGLADRRATITHARGGGAHLGPETAPFRSRSGSRGAVWGLRVRHSGLLARGRLVRLEAGWGCSWAAGAALDWLKGLSWSSGAVWGRMGASHGLLGLLGVS